MSRASFANLMLNAVLIVPASTWTSFCVVAFLKVVQETNPHEWQSLVSGLIKIPIASLGFVFGVAGLANLGDVLKKTNHPQWHSFFWLAIGGGAKLAFDRW